MEPQRFQYDDLSGGLNEGQPATEIKDNECTILKNYYPFGRKLVRRRGTYKLSGANSENITGIFNLHSAAGVVTTIIAGLTGFGKIDGSSITALANGEGTTLTSDDHPWVLLQYKNTGYAMRKLVGLRRFSETAHSTAGTAAPSTAPTLADGGAGGVHTAAVYQGVVTYLNMASGNESNPSAAGSVTLGSSSRYINWSAIPISPSGYIDARRLYRTLPDSAGIYFFVAELQDNFTTTYVDNRTISDLGDEASFDNGLPPVQFIAGDIWNECLFATDGDDVYKSEPFLPEGYSGDVIRVFPDDGHKIRAMHADGGRFIIGKTKGIHYLVPSGDTFSLHTLSDKHGCVSHHSMKSAEGLLLWYGGDSFYRSFGGGAPESIATVKLRDTLALIPEARKEYVVSAIYPKYGWYLSSVTVGLTATQNNTILCYNYKSDTWAMFTYPWPYGTGAAPACFGEVHDEDYEQVLYCAMTTYPLQMERGLTDFAVFDSVPQEFDITAEFRTKAHRWNQMGLLSCIRRFFIQCTTVANPLEANAVFEFYRDQEAGVGITRSVSLYTPGRPMKGYNLPRHNPGAHWQMNFRYNANPHIEVEAVAFEALPLARRVLVL